MKGIDIEKTKAYYKEIGLEDLCNCNYCKNYYLQIKEEYPEVSAYLADLGIDIRKPFELISLEPDANSMLEYCSCQYIAMGTCETLFEHRIGDIDIGLAQVHPSTNIKDTHFILEIYPVYLQMKLPLD